MPRLVSPRPRFRVETLESRFVPCAIAFGTFPPPALVSLGPPLVGSGSDRDGMPIGGEVHTVATGDSAQTEGMAGLGTCGQAATTAVQDSPAGGGAGAFSLLPPAPAEALLAGAYRGT